jgi:hypothetical protein
LGHLFHRVGWQKIQAACYSAPSTPLKTQTRQNLNAKVLHEEKGLKTYILVFDKGDEVRTGLLEFANTNRFADAHLTLSALSAR